MLTSPDEADSRIGDSWRARAADQIGRIIFGTGLHHRLLRGRAVIALFHRIDERWADRPITITEAEFDSYCRFFSRYFEVLPLTDLIDRLERGGDIGSCLAITFDDGYRDNLERAVPILERYGLPATFFLTTGFIGTERVPAWDAQAGVRSEWLDWVDVADLVRKGFDVGAHTVSHPDLGVTEGMIAEREIAGSKKRLEAELGMPVSLFAYPFGGRDKMSEANRNRVRHGGFRCCLSAFGGLVSMETDPFRLPRVAVDRWFRSPYHWGTMLLYSERRRDL